MSSIANTKEEQSDADKLIETLRDMTLGLDIRKVLPKIAEIGLRIIEETEIPELFQLLDTLVSLSDGTLDLNQLQLHVAMGMEVVNRLHTDNKNELSARLRSRLSRG